MQGLGLRGASFQGAHFLFCKVLMLLSALNFSKPFPKEEMVSFPSVSQSNMVVWSFASLFCCW